MPGRVIITLQIVKILSVWTNGPHTRFYISLEHLQLISRGFALYKEMYSQEEFLYARICNLKMTQKCTRGRKKCVLTSKTICFDKFVNSIFSRRCISQNCIEGEEVALSLSPYYFFMYFQKETEIFPLGPLCIV